MDDFLWRARAAGVGAALVAGPFGSFVIWRRMAYFGDTLAHASLLGVALGFALRVHTAVGVLAVCAGVALLLLALQRRRRLPGDAILGILSHGALSLGLVTDIEEDPLQAARDMAAGLAQRSPDAIRGIKRLVNEAWALDEATALALEARLQLEVMGKPNQREAVRANLEKREPRFDD